MLAPVVHSHLSKTLRGGARDGLCDCENNSNFSLSSTPLQKLHYNSFVTSTTAKEHQHQQLWGVFYNLPQLIVQLIIPLG